MKEPEYVTTSRMAYDAVATTYHHLLKDDLATATSDRAVLSAFAEQVPGGRVVDAGCGPGRLTGHLRSLGLDVVGLDLSPAMIAVARDQHPDLRFHVGELAAMPYEDEALDGVIAWYSIIHTPPTDQLAIFTEFARVLRDGGMLLLAFQVGDDVRRRTEPYGHHISTPLESYRLQPVRVTELLSQAGLQTSATLVCEATPSEHVPQAYILARRDPRVGRPPRERAHE